MQMLSRKAFHAVRKTRVTKEIIDQVRDRVASGRLRPGDRLPAERELAETFGVGRSTVREAIRAMESLGLLETRAGEGTFVADPSGGRGHNPLTDGLFQVWSTQHKLFEVRRVLEPGLTALAARRATTEQIEKLRAVLIEQESQIRRGETGMQEDTTFHFLLAEATGNEVLLRIVDSLMDLLRETRQAALQRGGRPGESLKQHRAILQAIENRDPAAAERRMRQHIRDVEKLVFSAAHQPPTERASSTSPPEPGVSA